MTRYTHNKPSDNFKLETNPVKIFLQFFAIFAAICLMWSLFHLLWPFIPVLFFLGLLNGSIKG